MKQRYIIGCTGHIKLSRLNNFDEAEVRQKIRKKLLSLCDIYRVELWCGLAYGADSLFAEEALSCGVEVCAVLPCPEKEFAAEQIDGGELFNRLIQKVSSIIIAADTVNRYEGVSKKIVQNCNELWAIWDGKIMPLTDAQGKHINHGGTYHTMVLALRENKSVFIVNGGEGEIIKWNC
ncbi:MAG: hypothetical protein ACI4QI_05225 [Candidatus Coproplasma sp.]